METLTVIILSVAAIAIAVAVFFFLQGMVQQQSVTTDFSFSMEVVRVGATCHYSLMVRNTGTTILPQIRLEVGAGGSLTTWAIVPVNLNPGQTFSYGGTCQLLLNVGEGYMVVVSVLDSSGTKILIQKTAVIYPRGG